MFLTPEELKRRREERRQHIRKVERRQIYWPMIIAFIIILGLAVFLVALPGDAGNNLVVFLMFLCPMAVLLYAVYVVLMLVVFGFRGGNAYGFLGLEKLNTLAEQVRHVTLTTTKRVNAESVRFNAAVTPATDLMNKVVEPERRKATAAQSEVNKPHDSTLPR
jgi:hypothetical protein